jgi:hypothetical protein
VNLQNFTLRPNEPEKIPEGTSFNKQASIIDSNKVLFILNKKQQPQAKITEKKNKIVYENYWDDKSVEQSYRDIDLIAEEKQQSKKTQSVDLVLDFERNQKSNNYHNNSITKTNNKNENSSNKSGFKKCCFLLC